MSDVIVRPAGVMSQRARAAVSPVVTSRRALVIRSPATTITLLVAERRACDSATESRGLRRSIRQRRRDTPRDRQTNGRRMTHRLLISAVRSIEECVHLAKRHRILASLCTSAGALQLDAVDNPGSDCILSQTTVALYTERISTSHRPYCL